MAAAQRSASKLDTSATDNDFEGMPIIKIAHSQKKSIFRCMALL